MRLNRMAGLALGGLLLASGMAGTSMAQQAAPSAPEAGRAYHRPDPAAMAARRAHLRDALQLRPDQEAALRTYLDSHKRPDGMRERGGRERMAQMTTPQRLDAMRTRMTERMAQFDRRAAATKRFYAQLSPSQQKAFDAMAPRGMGKGGHRGGMRGGHGPMGRG